MVYTFVMTKQKITRQTFEKSKFYSVQDMGIAYICALVMPYVISLLLILVCQIVISSGVPADSIKNSVVYTIFSCLCSPIAFAIVFFGFNKIKKVSFSASKVKFKIGTINTIICFVVALISVFGMQYFIGGIDHLLELGGYNLQSVSLPTENFGWLVLSLILLALLPAIFEELIFRGILLNGLRQGLSDIAALFMSALMFALIHGSIQQLVYPFALGLVLGWLAMRTGSTFTSMLVHFLNNAIVLIVNYFTARHELNMAIEYNAWQWVVAIVVAIVAGVLIYLIERFYFKGKNQDETLEAEQNQVKQEKKGFKNLPISFWVSIGIAVIIFIIGTAIGFMPSETVNI